MGAESTYGRRRPCSRECCMPPTRAQDREHVRRDVAAQLDWLVADANEHGLYESTADPRPTR